jgi:hypothetical protein
MSELISKNPLVEKIVAGQVKAEVLDMLIEGALALTSEEMLEALTFLLKDVKYREKALAGLRQIPESSKANYIRKSKANHRVAYLILSEALLQKNDKLAALAVHNQALPVDFLIKVAEKGTIEMLEILLENQIKMIAFPHIMDAIEKNPAANNFIKGKINEIREFYLKNDQAEKIPEEVVLEDAAAISAEGDIGSESEEEPDFITEQEYQDNALSLLQIINNMTTSERIKLALTGTRSHRLILVKDANRMVQMSVLESPKIGVDEVLHLVRNKSISGDVITRISTNRDWTKNYEITHGLVLNPKTPVKTAISFVKKLHLRDLMTVMRDKNISPVVRNLAVNFYREKAKVKKKS